MRPLSLHFSRLMTISLILLALFILFTSAFSRSMSNLEATTVWLIQDDMRDPETLRETARFIRDSLLNTWQAPQSQGLIAIYYLALDAWSLLVGISDFTLRILSVFVSMIGLACIYRAGRTLSSFRIAIMITLLIGISGFIINQSQAIPNWQGISTQANEVRSLDEPALVYLIEPSPLAYYANTGLLDGISINIGWRDFTSQEIRTLGRTFDNRSQVWAITEMSALQSWDAVATLSTNRGVSYRDALAGTILYQFDDNSSEALSFTFSDDNDALFAYRGNFYTNYEVTSNQEICIPLDLEVLTDQTTPYTIQISLLDMIDTNMSQVEVVLSPSAIGIRYTAEHCISIPANGDYRVGLMIMDNQDQPLSVLESDYFWSNFMIIGSVSHNDS